MISDQEIRQIVVSFETAKSIEAEAGWDLLRPLGVGILPYFLEYYPKMRKSQGRVTLLFHSIKWARESEDAFQLGIAALRDRATLVRYRACMLLAYSQRKDAIPHLSQLLKHEDPETVNDAQAAIDAIENRNHHYFVDRNHSGTIMWHVSDTDAIPKKPWWRIW
nr:HEAT repeat domain-containing protein [uncultured Undibacterium sp.]